MASQGIEDRVICSLPRSVWQKLIGDLRDDVNCTQKPFKRTADLDRHIKQVHGPKTHRDTYRCDYKKCQRVHSTEDIFERRDHFRDHLREFHKEDLVKRGGGGKYGCDYKRCQSFHPREDVLHRRDHFRDHLREFHKEDLIKGGGGDISLAQRQACGSRLVEVQ